MTDPEPEHWWDWTDAATWRANDDEGGNDEPHCDRT